MYARWPIAGEVDEILIKSSDYVMDTAHDLRLRVKSRTQQQKAKVRLHLFAKGIRFPFLLSITSNVQSSSN